MVAIKISLKKSHLCTLPVNANNRILGNLTFEIQLETKCNCLYSQSFFHFIQFKLDFISSVVNYCSVMNISAFFPHNFHPWIRSTHLVPLSVDIHRAPSDQSPSSGGVVTLKTERREVPNLNPGRACQSNRSEFSVVFSETRVNTG